MPLPMPVKAIFEKRLALPVFGAPMFIVSTPELVIAQCKAGIVGAFPALNARPASLLDEWIAQIREELAAHDAANPDRLSAPFAVNQIVHRSNDRLEQDMAMCEKHKVPIVITSLGARPEVNQAVHGWGGITMHDVINLTFAHKAIEKGADGLIAVAAGAGGHAGTLSPFALISEIREWFDGPLALSGAIATGGGIRAAQMMGADFAYIGSPFIATSEAHAVDAYKRMIVESAADDILYTNYFSGIHGNYLKPSMVAAGYDPATLESADASKMNFGASGSGGDKKAWRDVWGCGQGIGAVKEIVPVAERIAALHAEYARACSLENQLELRPT
jgi:nitronate monooxygenase